MINPHEYEVTLLFMRNVLAMSCMQLYISMNSAKRPPQLNSNRMLDGKYLAISLLLS